MWKASRLDEAPGVELLLSDAEQQNEFVAVLENLPGNGIDEYASAAGSRWVNLKACETKAHIQPSREGLPNP